MALDYLTSNGLNKYPFADTSTLTTVDTSYSFPNNFFLDIIFISKSSEIVGAYLSSLSKAGGDFALTFTTFEDVVEAVIFVIPVEDIIEKETFVFANDAVAVKIVFGKGFVDAVDWEDIEYDFERGATELAVSAIVNAVPKVPIIQFCNWDNDDNEPTDPIASFTGDHLTPLDDLTLQEGTNIAFVQENGLSIDVSRGAGAGLYNPCEDSPVIREINSVPPDPNGNFQFLTDECYVSTKGFDPGTGWIDNFGLTVENICTPKCTVEQLSNYAHYLNRIKDGLSDVVTYATQVKDNVEDEINRYANEVVPTQNLPSFKIKYEKFASVNPSKFYWSFAIGFFNPTDGPVALNASVDTNGLFKAKSYRVENATTIMTTSTITTSVPCLKVGILEAVVFGEPGDEFGLSGTFGGIALTTLVTLE